MDDKISAITVSLDKDLKRALRIEAARRDISMAQLLRIILSEAVGVVTSRG